ncbi:MAG: hypothetical protein OXC19_18165, partial [Bryobacterales bacterium]|nr:hypothetical protein [Bryobacterales bacterium]
QAGMSLQIEMQDHPPMIPTPPGEPPSGSFLVGINPSLQAHLSLEKAATPVQCESSGTVDPCALSNFSPVAPSEAYYRMGWSP